MNFADGAVNMKKNPNLKLERIDTLHLKVANVLRQEILNGNIEPGERLVQEELATTLGVSRMPIREALRILEAEGLVELQPHRGAVVRSLGMEDVEEIYALRALLEEVATRKSVDKLTEEEIARLEQLTQIMKKSEGSEEFVNANIEFHSLLMKHCPWERLNTMIEKLWNGFPQQTPTMLPRQMEFSNQEHDEILKAVKNRDSKRASQLIAKHIKRTGESLVKNLNKKSKSQ